MDINILDKLFDVFGQAAILWVAIYFLLKTLAGQYNDRIASLERKSDDCEKDRAKLHNRIDEQNSERINVLEELARKRA